jgi:hypothetical protein
MAGVISIYWIPMTGLAIFQNFSIDLMVLSINSLLIGRAKAIPCPSVIAVVIPITLPSISMRGPPLFPGFTNASV